MASASMCMFAALSVILGIGAALVLAGLLARRPTTGRVCAACRHANAADARFCARCGQAFDGPGRAGDSHA